MRTSQVHTKFQQACEDVRNKWKEGIEYSLKTFLDIVNDILSFSHTFDTYTLGIECMYDKMRKLKVFFFF